MDFWIIPFLFIIGLIIGSFLNVVILRSFSGESIVLPPSHCTKCSEKLKWYDNIPVLSFLILKGKCRYCKVKISPQYPIVELLAGFCFVASYLRFGLSINMVLLCAILSIFIILSITDIKERVVFNIHTYVLMGLGFIFAIYNGFILQSIIGAVIGFVIIELIARISKLYLGERAFGEGDSLIAIGLGALFGWKVLLMVLVLSVVLQALYVLPMIVKKMYQNAQYKIMIALIVFLLSVITFRVLDFYGMLNSTPALIFGITWLVFLGFYCSKHLLANAKSGQSLTYIPFGPALIISSTFMIFAGSFVKSLF